MSFKKIPKDVWDTFSDDEKRFHELEYKKEFERNKRLMMFLTRGVALICIFVLFFIGVAMFEQAKEYGKIKDQYGDYAFCYLCGLDFGKKCECQYLSDYAYDDYLSSEEHLLSIAEYNTKICSRTKVIGSKGKFPQIP